MSQPDVDRSIDYMKAFLAEYQRAADEEGTTNEQ